MKLEFIAHLVSDDGVPYAHRIMTNDFEQTHSEAVCRVKEISEAMNLLLMDRIKPDEFLRKYEEMKAAFEQRSKA